MRPTIDEQLAGIDRLLHLVADDPKLGEESTLLLRDARRQLGRLRGSLPARLPFLRWDNAASTAVLRAIAPVVPNSLQAAIAELPLDRPEVADSQTDDPEELAAELNDRLRDLLAQALDAVADTVEGEAARLQIVEHLRARVDANPALNKNPISQTPRPRPASQ